tara:strand:+ start:237 stop:1061 length:825 start_codon:yes stop_codon:yes gene_type:complete
MKLRHNKKRNTAFLFEALIRELTKAVIKEDLRRKNKVVRIIKNGFGKETALRKELELYKSLQRDQDLKPHLAEKLIYETRAQYKKINKEKLFEEQSSLIKEINTALSKDVFSNFVPNFKNIATIYQIFNDELLPKKRVLLEDTLMEWLTGKKEKLSENKSSSVDGIVMKKFVERFNQKYNSSLMAEQKELLQKYIFSFMDDGLEFKLYLNEELGRLKSVVKSSLQTDEIKSDANMCRKSEQVLEVMEGFKKTPISNSIVEKIIKIQKLASEIQS